MNMLPIREGKFQTLPLMINFACWNIRGLNDPLKQKEIRSLTCNNKLDVIGIVETKVKYKNAASISRSTSVNWNGMKIMFFSEKGEYGLDGILRM